MDHDNTCRSKKLYAMSVVCKQIASFRDSRMWKISSHILIFCLMLYE